MPTFHKNSKPILNKKKLDLEESQLGFESKVSNITPSKPDLKSPTKKIDHKKDHKIIEKDDSFDKTSEENPKILKLYKTVSKIEKSFSLRTNLMALAIASLVIFNLVFVFTKPQTNDQSKEVDAVLQKNKDQSSNDKKIKNQASLFSFQNNPAIFDYGFKIDLQPNSISNVDDPNCQTPIVPPTVNGCGFALDIQKLDLPSNGIFLKYLTLETDAMSSDQKIQVDLKDYEKGEIAQNIGTISTQPNSKKIFLPANIPSGQSLYFRFWTSKGAVKINKILLDYFSFEDLKQIQIKPEVPIKDKKTASVFQDIDEDGKYTATKDKLWGCSSTFPGVVPVDLQNKDVIDLIRDDSCMTEAKPESWKKDSGQASLPPGKWLLVVDNSDFSSFEVKDSDGKQSFNLKI
jgi:hypothetical protein